MKMFHWPLANCIREYSVGDIIVMAKTADQAREHARSQIEAYLQESRSWWYLFSITDGSKELDEDDKHQHAEFMREFEADLAKEPDERTVIFIRGGE